MKGDTYKLILNLNHSDGAFAFAVYDENSMASRMNSGGSIDLNRIKIDPRTGEKFSFNEINTFNPSNDETTFIQSTRTQRFLKTI